MDTTEWTITSSPAMQAVEAEAERQHLANTADTDRLLIGDDQGPHWRAVEHAEQVLSRVDARAMHTIQNLDAQCDARGREISRLRAELATAKAQVAAVLALPSIGYEALELMDPEQYHQAIGYNDGLAASTHAINDTTTGES